MRRIVVSFLLFLLVVSQVRAEWKYAVMGDTRGDAKTPNADNTAWLDGGVNVVVLADIASALGTEEVDFVIVLGDFISKWKKNLVVDSASLVDDELALWTQVWESASGDLRVIPIRGNHEATTGGGATQEDMIDVWLSYFPDMPRNGPQGAEGLTYSFTYKGVLFVGLDQYVSEKGDLAQVDLDWVDGELESSNALQKFVFGHAPAFPSTDPDLPDIQKALPSPGGDLLPEAQAERDQFWDILGDNGLQVYLTAHEHIYARGTALDSAGKEILQVIVGTAGAPLDPPLQLVYVENYDITDPLNPVPLEVPRIHEDFDDIATGRFGYMVVVVKGPKIEATYKAKPFELTEEGWASAGAEYEVIDEWSYRVRPAK